MGKILILVFSDIKKNKSSAIILGVMAMLAALFLNLGLYMFSGFNVFFDTKTKELNSPHVSAVMASVMYNDGLASFAENYPGIKQTNKEDILFFPAAEFEYGKGRYSNNVIILKADESRNLPKLVFTERDVNITEAMIYAPYVLKTGGGYALGDEFIMTVQGKNHTFKIGGFVEDVMFGGLNSGVMAFYLPETLFAEHSRSLTDFDGMILSASFDSQTDAEAFAYDFQTRLDPAFGGVFSPFARVQEISGIKFARTFTLNIGALLIIAAAAIMTAVTLAVIKSRITCGIEEDLRGIGTLKALGYTGPQIIAVYTIRFAVIAAASGLIGCALSYAAAIPAASLLTAQTGLRWTLGFDAVTTVASFLFVGLSVAAVAYFTAHRIKKISPVSAFGGTNGKAAADKNKSRLQKSRMGLIPSLAVNNSRSSFRQNMMLSGILAAVCFASVFALTLFYNMSYDNRAFLNMVGGEPCDVILTVSPGNDASEYAESISSLKHVEKVITFDMAGVITERTVTAAFAAENYGELTNCQVYEGRYPANRNEAAIGGVLAQSAGKRLGDTIEICSGDQTGEYIITGLSQGTNYGGKEVYLTYGEIERIVPGFVRSTLYIYAEGTGRAADIIADLNDLYVAELAMVVDYNAMAESVLGAYSGLVSSMAAVILAVISLVSALILTLVVSSTIVRGKSVLGIQKSLGFTTRQLMLQTALSFLPAVLIGAVIGGILGIAFTNPLLSLLFSSMGIQKTNFIVPILLTALSCATLCFICFGVAFFTSRRLRNIAPLALITK